MISLYTIKLENVDRNRKNVGNKAIALGELMNSGLPVPPGFVITSDAFEKFLRANKIGNKIAEILSNINFSDYQSVFQASQEIHELILSGSFPDYIEKPIKEEYEELSIGREAKELGGIAFDLIKAGRTEICVAVRASLSSQELPYANFEGQTATFLNIRGNHQLLNAIKECWASVFSPRALIYRKKKRITKIPTVGIIVQKMLEAEKSGFIFTSQPEKNDRSKIVIEASWGFAESLTSGIVTPDEYIIDRETGRIIEQKIRKKMWMKKRDEISGKIIKEPVSRENMERNTLNESEIKKLCEFAIKAERHFNGQSQILQWSVERNRIFILSSSSIPTFGSPVAFESFNEGEIAAGGIPVSLGVVKGKIKLVLSPEDLYKIEAGDITVLKMTHDAILPFMEKIAGIITDDGGRMCHAAVISREFGVPCIVGTETATSTLKNDQNVVLNAVNGNIYIHSEPVVAEPLTSLNPVHAVSNLSNNDTVTATNVKIAIASPEIHESSLKDVDGAVVIKPEYMLSGINKHPFFLLKNIPEEFENRLIESLKKIANAIYPKPLIYRGMDIRTDEFMYLEGGDEEPKEQNPLLGWHGIRRSIDDGEILLFEIRMLRKLYSEGINNVGFAIPFISSVEELKRVKNSIDFPLKTGITVETPASAIAIEEFCREGMDFVLINYDILAQLVLGVDRDNANVSKMYSESNSAVLNLIKHVIKTCKSYRIKTIVYGDVIRSAEALENMIRSGADSFCITEEGINETKNLIYRIERKLLLEKIGENEQKVFKF